MQNEAEAQSYIVKRFTDRSPKPGTPCEKLLILFNLFLDKRRKWGPGRWGLWGNFALFSEENGVCGWDSTRVRIPTCQRPSLGPFLLTTFFLELQYPSRAASWKKREIGRKSLETKVTQSAPPHPLGRLPKFLHLLPTPLFLSSLHFPQFRERNLRNVILAPFLS